MKLKSMFGLRLFALSLLLFFIASCGSHTPVTNAIVKCPVWCESVAVVRDWDFDSMRVIYSGDSAEFSAVGTALRLMVHAIPKSSVVKVRKYQVKETVDFGFDERNYVRATADGWTELAVGDGEFVIAPKYQRL